MGTAPDGRVQTVHPAQQLQLTIVGAERFGNQDGEILRGNEVDDGQGGKVPVHMGAHGIGVSRLLGAIIEASHDDNGIIWPEGVTPFHCGIVNLKQGDEQADAACEALYASLTALGLEPLYDARNERAGGKFATMDLIGLPWRITVGPRGLKNGVVELTSRRTGESEELPPEQAIAKVAAIYGRAQACCCAPRPSCAAWRALRQRNPQRTMSSAQSTIG